MVTTKQTNNNRMNLEQVCSLNVEQSRLLQYSPSGILQVLPDGGKHQLGASGSRWKQHVGAGDLWRVFRAGSCSGGEAGGEEGEGKETEKGESEEGEELKRLYDELQIDTRSSCSETHTKRLNWKEALRWTVDRHQTLTVFLEWRRGPTQRGSKKRGFTKSCGS